MKGDFNLGQWLVQPSAGRATRNGETVHLRAKVMDLLVFLAKRSGEVVSKGTILDGVWGTEALSESALTRSITELRQALGDDAEEPTLVETIPKRGYRLIAPVQLAPTIPAIEATEAAERSSKPLRSDGLGPRQPRWRRSLGWGAAAVVLLTEAGWAWRTARGAGSPGDPPVVRFLISPPEGTTFAAYPVDPSPAISPDGRRIATVARTPLATYQIWIHAVDSVIPQPLVGAEDGEDPFWSPDGRYVGFFAHGKLMKVRVSGGPAETVCAAPGLFGAAWSHLGLVLFAPGRASGLYRVPVSGGEPVAVTRLDPSRAESSHRFPHFLPDGRRFLYLVLSQHAEHRGIFIGSLDSAERKRLVAADSNAIYVPPGYIVFVRGTALMAQGFDADRLELTGEAVAIAGGVLPAPTVRFAPFAAAAGVLTYRTGGIQRTTLMWMDRHGRRLGSVGPHARYLTPALSPDGNQLAVDVLDPRSENVDIWVFDLKRNVSSRVTFGDSPDGYPLWAGVRRLIFASNREGTWNLYERDLNEGGDGGSIERVLLESSANKYPQGWSTVDQSLVYADQNAITGHDLWRLPLSGSRKPIPLFHTSFNETQAQLSPDGRWLAYTSDESGRFEVYVRALGSGTGKWRISRGIGCQPRWRGDSTELFYLEGQQIMSVMVEQGTSLQPGVARPLFATQVARSSELTWDYAVTADGQRFLVKELIFEEGGSPMTVVLNWQQLIGR